MIPTKKREGFKGQRAIVIPGKILNQHFGIHPIVKQLHITDIGYYPNAQYHHRQRSHGINQCVLIYCVKGKGWARIGERNYSLSADDIVLLPANIPHEYGADEQTPWTIYWLHFKGTSSSDFVDMMLKKMGDYAVSISFQENRLQLFEEIYKSLEKGYGIDNICYASLSLQYFLGSCCFDNYYMVTHEKTDSISVCVNYLQKNIDKPLSLRDIANTVNLSVSHFASVFKKSTGFSVIEYFNQLKTQKACQYLQFTDLRINEIADRLGIEDPHYFSRMFTKIVGVSPNKYRNRKKIPVRTGSPGK